MSRKGKSRDRVPAFQSHLSVGGDFLCTFEYGLYCGLVQSRSNSALYRGARSDGRQRVAPLPSHVFILTEFALTLSGRFYLFHRLASPYTVHCDCMRSQSPQERYLLRRCNQLHSRNATQYFLPLPLGVRPSSKLLFIGFCPCFGHTPRFVCDIPHLALDEIFTGVYYSVSALYWYLTPSLRKEVHA